MSESVGFKRLSDDAIIPTRAHKTDRGFDLYATENVIIEPGETKIIPTGIAVQLPKGMEAQVRPRRGVTGKTKLRVQLGTIDNSYTGEIGVIVDCVGYVLNKDGSISPRYGLVDGSVSEEEIESSNYGSHKIRKGDRIAQLVVQHLPQVEAVEVDTLDETDRGEGGFGSTGTSWEDNVNPPTIDELITLGESVSGSTKEDE